MGWHIASWAKQFDPSLFGVTGEPGPVDSRITEALLAVAGHTTEVRYGLDGCLQVEICTWGMEFGFKAAKAGLDIYWCLIPSSPKAPTAKEDEEQERQYPVVAYFACRGTDEIVAQYTKVLEAAIEPGMTLADVAEMGGLEMKVND